MSKKAKKIKLTATQTIQVWNILAGKESSNPHYTAWVKRLVSYMKPEVELWNGLTKEEREVVKDSTLCYPVDKIEAKNLPELIYEEEAELLSLIAEGKIKPYESQLKKALNG